MSEEKLTTEIPGQLKQLARLIVRGFYTIEDTLIVDMLVRNPCMKEDDICELLKFERKMLRARISTLKNDKFIQVRLRMETGVDGKAQKVNYYFINYKTFVNVVKYKVDIMRKRLETEERDATSRASFKCPGCFKTFTDLEADQLFDFTTSEFRCTFCQAVVEEDMSALPKKDSRLLLAKFNEQLEPIYFLLREVEGIKLAPEILEPEPVDISTIRGLDKKFLNQSSSIGGGDSWSGEATRNSGFMVEEARVDVTIGDENDSSALTTRKEAPIWMMESTVITKDPDLDANKLAESLMDGAGEGAAGSSTSKANDDIMSVLLAHEKRPSAVAVNTLLTTNSNSHRKEDSDSSSDEMMHQHEANKEDTMTAEMSESDEEDEDDATVPTVTVGNRVYNVTDINDTIIAEMTQVEKEIYVQVFQDYYSHMNY